MNLFNNKKDLVQEFFSLDWLNGMTLSFSERNGQYRLKGNVLRRHRSILHVLQHSTITLRGDFENYCDNISMFRQHNSDLGFEIMTENAEAFVDLINNLDINLNLDSNFGKNLLVYNALSKKSVFNGRSS